MNLKKLHYWLPLLVSVLVVNACTDESPTDVGDDLLSSGDVRTFEVILDPSAFLTFDTTFTGYTKPQDATFSMVANKFGGVVDSNVLLRFQQPVDIISVRNAAGTLVTDSNPQYFAGRLVVRIDTIRSDSDVPVKFNTFRTAEAWDMSATWTLRIDTGNVQLPWSTPGGTRGAQIDTATWAAADSVVFDVDSATIAQFRDTANAARGLLIVSETPGSRLRLAAATLRLSARSTIRPDTVLNFDVALSAAAFIVNPPAPPAGSQLRVGGVPSWRTMLGVNPELRNMTFPCPGIANCQVRLDRVHINRAELLLQPVAAPSGFIPEDSTVIHARTLLLSPGVPLQRSPLGVAIAGSDVLAPSLFAQPPAATPVAIDVTSYIVALVDEDITEANRPASALTLIAFNEPITFGFAAFAPGPRLRLVLTAAVEGGQ